MSNFIRNMRTKLRELVGENNFGWTREAFDAFLRQRGEYSTRKIAGNTYVRRDGTSFSVQYHQTLVVTHNADGSITLNSGGWRTATTKERINAFCPWSVFQEKHVWYVSLPNNPREPFVDGMRISAKGRVVRAGKAA